MKVTAKFDQDINVLNLETVSKWGGYSVLYVKNGKIKAARPWTWKSFIYKHSSTARYLIGMQLKNALDKLGTAVSKLPPDKSAKVLEKIAKVKNKFISPQITADDRGETVDNENLKALMEGSAGQRFCLVKGHLKKIPFTTRLALSTFDLREINKAHVKQTVTHLIQRECARTGITSYQQAALRKLFSEKLSYLSETVFDRTLVSASSRAALEPQELIDTRTPTFQTIEEELSELEFERDAKATAMRNLKDDMEALHNHESPEYKLKKSMLDDVTMEVDTMDIQISQTKEFKKLQEEAAQAQALGIRMKKGNGYAQSFIRRGIDGRPLMIFKPYKFDSIGPNPPFPPHRVRNFFGRNLPKSLGGDPLFYRYIGNNTHHSETACYLTAANIGKPTLVPYTRVTHMLRGKQGLLVGSAMMFKRGAQDATKFFHMNKKYQFESPAYREAANAKLSDEQFDDLVIIDVLTGHLDRHAENFMIIPDENGNVKSLFAIDGGIAFAPEHPDSCFPTSTQKPYLWARNRFPHGDRPFTQYGKELINTIYARRSILAARLEKFYRGQGADPIISAKRIQCMRDRIEVLKHLADNNLPKRAVLDYTTKMQIANLLRARGVN